jgi:hypothetical protein
MYDEDFDEKRKLVIGQAYECEVKVVRNYQFLKKAFSLLNAAWSLMTERQQAGWRSKEGFRAYLTVASGFYDVYYNPRLQAFVEQPKSWAFDKMDEATFSDLYDRMKDVIFAVLGDKVTEEVFDKVLSNF